MPQAKRLRDGTEAASTSERVQEAVEDGSLVLSSHAVDTGALEQEQESEKGTVPSVVKMKLNSFCVNARLRASINSMVLDMNRLLAESYAFSNLHILRLLQRSPIGEGIPAIDRNFYYRCILAVSLNRCRRGTLSDDWVASISAFDALRPHGSSKVDIREHNQTVAALSITMATMGTNHLWMNLEGRLSRYVRNFHPQLKAWTRRIVNAILKLPSKELTVLFPSPAGSHPSSAATERVLAARRLCLSLRQLLPMRNGQQFASRAHLTLPLYYRILQDTERARAEYDGKSDAANLLRPYRLFSLLPHKSGYTVSYIPISSMALLHLLRTLGMEKLAGDGRKMNPRAFWDKYFNLKGVETHDRRFDGSISTDGCSVSILMSKPSSLVMRSDEPCCCEMRTLLRERDMCRVVGVDPGFTDVVTIASAGDGAKPQSYSSSRYYEESKVYLSRHRTSKWNEDTASVVLDAPTARTTNLERYAAYATHYLAVIQTLLAHRASMGYRNMRFMRYIHKRKAITRICTLIAPPDKITIVGFGDWSGGSGSPISRRTCGPLQEIKFQLRKQSNVFFKEMDEHRTSQTCNGCLQQLHNMKTLGTVVNRFDGSRTVRTNRVHKVLHCKNSDGGNSNRCGTSWDRDVNASRNLLMLMMCHVLGYERPPAFTRSWRQHTATLLAGSAVQCTVQGVMPLGGLFAAPLPSPNRGHTQ